MNISKIICIIISAIAALACAPVAHAATYGVTATWTDPTPTGPEYVKSYSAEVRVNGGTANALNALTSASFATTATAVAGDTIEVRVKAINIVTPATPIPGAWTAWVSAVAPIVGVTPSNQTNLSITVSPQP